MNRLNLIVSFLIILNFNSCSKPGDDINNLSDSEFIELISNNKKPVKGISKIDSLVENNTLSQHKLALIYYEKGLYLMVSRKYVESIAYANKALSLFKKEKNKTNIGRTYNLLANDYINLNKDKEAEKYINIALDIFKKDNDKKNEVVAFDVLARLYYRNSNFTKALDILKKTLKIYTALDMKERKFATINNIGSIYKKIKDYKNAESYFKKAIILNNTNHFFNSNPLQELGILYLENNQPERCIDLHMQSLKIQNKTQNLAIQKEIYDVLIDSIKGKNLKPSIVIGNYFNNLPNFIRKRDSVEKLIENNKVEDRIKSIEAQYKLQTKKSELNQEIKLGNKNKWIFAIIIGLLLFLGLFLFQRNKNTKLKLNHDNLILEQKVLRSQMNPHFIFNALTSIQKNLLEDDILKSSSSLSKFAKLIRQNFEFISKKYITLDEDLDMLKNYIETQQLRFDNKFDYTINIQKGLDISYIQIPPMLLQPFVENAIEHGLRPLKEKGSLMINIVEVNEYIQFEIIDNGVGFKQKDKTDNREHATDIFLKRLQLRNLGEEKFFKIKPLENKRGTKVTFLLKL